ncbi:hypothetical protein [Haladaptatus sp. DYSN1]|uniref:hypothetical protein n=1 Tax=unclassified Haladaptatus TaxID=2622732 RepID=UPI002404AAFD|nr:hypothetical protein [Haladaptatus sp. DYSN1]
MSKLQGPPTVNWRGLNGGERDVLAKFMFEGPLDITTLEFVHCQVPLGIKRVDDAYRVQEGKPTEYNEKFARSYAELFRENGAPCGFWKSGEISDIGGFLLQSYTRSIDAIAVGPAEVHLLEIKTSGEKIESSSDVDKPLGQIVSYTNLFKEDYPDVFRNRALKRWVITMESKVDMTLVRPILAEFDVGFFDCTRPDCTIIPERV